MEFLLDLPLEFPFFAYGRIREEDGNIEALMVRTLKFKSVVFNLNSICDHQCLKDFRFKKKVIGSIVDLLA